MSILKVLRERTLKAAKASMAFSENVEKAVHNHAQYAKGQLTDGFTGQNLSDESHIAQLYYQMLDDYAKVRTLRVPKPMSSRSRALWRRVVSCCKSAGVSPERYLRAQFDWFHKHFGKTPLIYQLATETAIIRAQEFAGDETRKVVGNDIRHKVVLADLFKQCEKQLADVMRAQKMTREEVYKKLVIPGLLVFPKEFLNADPVYFNAASKADHAKGR